MVDPNRKINRLTEKDIEFLDECEEEFEKRYTEDDEEFMAHSAKPIPQPPVVENWSQSGGGGQYWNRNNNDNRQRKHYDGNRSNRPWNRRGYQNNFRRDKPYERWRDNSGGESRQYDAPHHSRQQQHSRNEPPRPPMNIPKGYGNFVAASRE